MLETTLPDLVADLVALRHAGGYRFKIQDVGDRVTRRRWNTIGDRNARLPGAARRQQHCSCDYDRARLQPTQQQQLDSFHPPSPVSMLAREPVTQPLAGQWAPGRRGSAR